MVFRLPAYATLMTHPIVLPLIATATALAASESRVAMKHLPEEKLRTKHEPRNSEGIEEVGERRHLLQGGDGGQRKVA